jgi:hypothetical protein
VSVILAKEDIAILREDKEIVIAMLRWQSCYYGDAGSTEPGGD